MFEQFAQGCTRNRGGLGLGSSCLDKIPVLVYIELNVGSWTQTEDVHGWGGVPHHFCALNECKEACINNIGCVAIDWEPSNVGYECWILSTSATSPTTAAGFITHYALNRDAVGETIFPLYTPRLGCF